MQKFERFITSLVNKRQKVETPKDLQPVRVLRIEEDPSEDLEFLFTSGKIESLVQEGRTPIRLGSFGGSNGENYPYFQVPPRGHKPELLARTYMSIGGAIVFVYLDGTQRIGATYTLSNGQTSELESRVEQELGRLSSEVNSE